MNGDHRPRPPASFAAQVFQMRFQAGRVERKAARLDVHEGGPRSQPRHRSRGGEKSEGRGHHFVPRLRSQGHQREQQRIRAGRAPNRMRHLAVVGQFPLQGLAFRAQNESLARAHPLQRRQDFVFQFGILRCQVKLRHLHGCAGFHAGRINLTHSPAASKAASACRQRRFWIASPSRHSHEDTVAHRRLSA